MPRCFFFSELQNIRRIIPTKANTAEKDDGFKSCITKLSPSIPERLRIQEVIVVPTLDTHNNTDCLAEFHNSRVYKADNHNGCCRRGLNHRSNSRTENESFNGAVSHFFQSFFQAYHRKGSQDRRPLNSYRTKRAPDRRAVVKP